MSIMIVLLLLTTAGLAILFGIAAYRGRIRLRLIPIKNKVQFVLMRKAGPHGDQDGSIPIAVKKPSDQGLIIPPGRSP